MSHCTCHPLLDANHKAVHSEGCVSRPRQAALSHATLIADLTKLTHDLQRAKDERDALAALAEVLRKALEKYQDQELGHAGTLP